MTWALCFANAAPISTDWLNPRLHSRQRWSGTGTSNAPGVSSASGRLM